MPTNISAPHASVQFDSIGGLLAYAVYVPVGPGEVESSRTIDLLESVLATNDDVAWIVLVDDSLDGRREEELLPRGTRCNATIIRNPRRGVGHGTTGGLCVANMVAFEHIQKHTNATFVLKLDTDSLVISPPGNMITTTLASHEDAGLLGVIGDSFGENRTYHWIAFHRRHFEFALELPDSYDGLDPQVQSALAGWGVTSEEDFQGLLRAKEILSKAVTNGYALGQYCHGGGYVVSRKLLDRMAADNAFRNPLTWRNLRLGEDAMMALFCGAASLTMHDVSQVSTPFAVQLGCVPLSRHALVEMGVSVLHSIKGSMEFEFREFFRARRLTTPTALSDLVYEAGAVQDHDVGNCGKAR